MFRFFTGRAVREKKPLQPWYPDKSRIEEIDRQLSQFAKHWQRAPDDWHLCLKTTSKILSKAHGTPGFPDEQMRRWVWLASQLRIRGETSHEVRVTSGAALTFLDSLVSANDEISPESKSDLHWVLSTTTEKLSDLIGPEEVRSLLSEQELANVEAELSRLQTDEPFDAGEYRAQVTDQLSDISAVSGQGYLQTILAKVDGLFLAAESDNPDEAAPARAALRYLGKKSDIVPDDLGILGLVDDVYVIEWAFAAVWRRTHWLPLLEANLTKWPFLGDLVIRSGDKYFRLDRFSQHVVSNILFHLTTATDNRSLVVLRENGPYPFIAATALALHIHRAKQKASGEQFHSFELNQSLVVGDESASFNVRYGGSMEIEGNTRHWLLVRKNGRISVEDDVLLSAKPATSDHRTLSLGNDVSLWLKKRHPNPIDHLVDYHDQDLTGRAVLLLTQRKTLEQFANDIKPFGSSVPALLGLRYRTSTGRDEDFPGSKTNTPLIYACSDPSAARELLLEPPEHVQGWMVLVDGARFGFITIDDLPPEEEIPTPKICILGELHEREDLLTLRQSHLSPLLLEYTDVETVSPTLESTPSNDSAAYGMLKRQGNYLIATRKVHSLAAPFYERLSQLLKEMRKNQNDGDDPLQILAICTSAFLQKAIGMPWDSDKDHKRELESLASNIQSQASILKSFNSAAAELFESFSSLNGLIPEIGRQEAIRRLLETEDDAGTREHAILCRSKPIAHRCLTLASDDPCFTSVRWLTIDELRDEPSAVRLIVPGWIDKKTMRRCCHSAFANHMDFVFLPFEKDWFEALTNAAAAYRRKLSIQSTKQFKDDWASTVRDSGKQPPLWKKIKLDAPEALSPNEEAQADGMHDQEVASEIDQLDTRTVSAIHSATRVSGEKADTAKARLVLFQDIDSYAFLPPNGSVLDLTPLEEKSPTFERRKHSIGSENTEQDLFRNVDSLQEGMLLAFPRERDRDFIDLQADRLMDDPTQVRKQANLWRDALRRYRLESGASIKELVQKLRAEGISRHPVTVTVWLNNNDTIAPRDYRRVIPAIARATSDKALNEEMKEVLSSVDLLYRCRAKATASFVGRIFSEGVDLTADRISFDLDGSQISYELHRVRRIGSIEEVPLSVIGRIQRLSALHGAVDEPQGMQL